MFPVCCDPTDRDRHGPTLPAVQSYLLEFFDEGLDSYLGAAFERACGEVDVKIHALLEDGVI